MSLLTAKVHFLFIQIFYTFDLQLAYISWLTIPWAGGARGGGLAGRVVHGRSREFPLDGDLILYPGYW